MTVHQYAKGALLFSSAVLLGLAASLADHGYVLLMAVVAMGSCALMFTAGLLVGYDIGAADVESEREDGHD